MSFVGTWYFEKLSPNIIVLEIPFLFKDLNSVNKFFDSSEAEEAIYTALNQKGIRWLASSPVGTYSLLLMGL
jgi:TRAP-type C4-dicarboxylate transport system substrate-binding protein